MERPMATCQRQLAALWFVGAAVLFALLLASTSRLMMYPGGLEEAWGWFSQTVLPTLALIVGVLVTESRDQASRGRKADYFLYRLAYALSIAYLLVVMLTALGQPFFTVMPGPWFKRSNLWVGVLQGLVSASLGAFFVKSGGASAPTRRRSRSG